MFSEVNAGVSKPPDARQNDTVGQVTESRDPVSLGREDRAHDAPPFSVVAVPSPTATQILMVGHEIPLSR
jgi:hypothetical protein